MPHYPGHLRQAFADWVDAGFPDTAVVEFDYVPREVPARTLLGIIHNCTDVMPGTLRQEVAEYLEPDGRGEACTYAQAARRIIAMQKSDQAAAERFRLHQAEQLIAKAKPHLREANA